MDRITYWLHYGAEIIGSVRAERGLSDAAVRSKAIASHDWLPLSHAGVTPWEHRARLAHARVVVYKDGN